jgi:hypothetical protein
MNAGQYPGGGAESGRCDSPMNNKMTRIELLLRKLTEFM